MITDTEIETLKAAHAGAELHLVESGESAIVVKTPSPSQWRKFVTESSNKQPGAASVAMENILAACTVWKSSPDLYEKRPGLVETFAGKVTEIAGLAQEARSKKL